MKSVKILRFAFAAMALATAFVMSALTPEEKQKMIDDLEFVSRYDDSYDDLIPMLAQSFYEEGEYDKMVRCLEIGLNIMETDANRVAILPQFLSLVNAPTVTTDHKKRIENLIDSAVAKIDPEVVVDLKSVLATYYSLGGDYHAAKDLLTDALKSPGLSAEEKITLEISLAESCFHVGDYEEAIKLSAAIIKSEASPEEKWDMLNLKISSLVSLIDTAPDRNSKQYKNWMNEFHKTVDESKGMVAHLRGNTAEAMAYLGLYEATMAFLADDNAAMIRAASEVEDIINKEMADDELSYTFLSSLALFHVKAGDYNKALELVANEPSGLTVAENYNWQVAAEAYLGLGDKPKAKLAYETLSRNIINDMSRNFPLLTERDKINYWNKFESQISNAGRYADEGDENDDFGGLVYDLALYSKGMLLNSAKTFASLMEKSPDPKVKGLYESYKTLQRRLADDLDLPAQKRKELEEEAEMIQLKLAEMVPESKNYMQALTYDWKEIRNALGDKDAAVEFLEMSDVDGRKYYGAAVVTPGLKNPVIINIGDVETTDKTISEAMSDQVWRKLLQYMNPDGKTFFSAAGNLHRLPLESLLTEDGKIIGSVYPLYRVSSTRELLKKNVGSGEGMVMFGGIDYGKKGGAGNATVRGVAYNLPYLPGTLKEVEEVVDMTKRDHLLPEAPLTFVGEEGTEENFRALSGKGKKIIHVATHGYYLPVKSEGVSKLPLSARKLYKRLDDIEDPLLHNGLLFAKVNIDEGTSTTNDGVVTALEISALDFEGTDLVVLSACESGLGNITGEGVFGLQRGFKMAGAGSMIISLEKVEDEATMLLMTEFYRRYLGGDAKHDAFERARQVLRERYPDGRQYAAFILVD